MNVSQAMGIDVRRSVPLRLSIQGLWLFSVLRSLINNKVTIGNFGKNVNYVMGCVQDVSSSEVEN